MEEIMLKVKYNELLARYNKGAEYLAKNPEDDKALEEFNKISDELNNIIQAIPNMTDREKTEGFDIETYAEFEEPEKVIEQPKAVIARQEPQQINTLEDFGNKWSMAEKLAKSSLLPDDFKGHPENIIIALGMAEKMKMDPFTICQNLHIIRGKLSWSGAFCKTLIEQSGKYTDLDFVYFGDENSDDYGCYLEATRIRDGKRIQGNKVTVKLAKEEKWYSTNPKWRNMTAQMLRV